MSAVLRAATLYSSPCVIVDAAAKGPPSSLLPLAAGDASGGDPPTVRVQAVRETASLSVHVAARATAHPTLDDASFADEQTVDEQTVDEQTVDERTVDERTVDEIDEATYRNDVAMPIPRSMAWRSTLTGVAARSPVPLAVAAPHVARSHGLQVEVPLAHPAYLPVSPIVQVDPQVDPEPSSVHIPFAARQAPARSSWRWALAGIGTFAAVLGLLTVVDADGPPRSAVTPTSRTAGPSAGAPREATSLPYAAPRAASPRPARPALGSRGSVPAAAQLVSRGVEPRELDTKGVDVSTLPLAPR